MAETKIKMQRKGGYTILPNEILRDHELNLQTKGLFCMMLSFPEDWDFSIGGLASVAGCGRDKIRSALRNLEDAGYLIREQERANGHFSSNLYVIQDWKISPLSGFPTTGNPSTGNPLTGNPTELNKDIIKERSNIPPIVPQGGRRKRAESKSQPDWRPERFAGLWDYYPHSKRGNKQKAIAAWDKLKAGDALIDDIGRRLKMMMASDDWQHGVGIPHVSTFLNQRRWEDADNYDGIGAQSGHTEEAGFGWQM